MTDTRDSLIQAIKKRLAEIEEKLDPYNALIEERTELLKILRRHQPLQGSQGVLIGPDWNFTIDTGHVINTWGGLPKPEPVSDQVKPSNGKSASATSTVVAEARHILEQTKRGRLPFPRLFEQLSESARAAFKGKYVKQAVKTAIQRSGYKFGIEYKKGGVVRLIQTGPE